MKIVSTYMILGIFLLSILTAYPLGVYAQNVEGSFLKYSFSHSGVKSGSGSLSLEVLDNFGNGTLRTQLTGSHNNMNFILERNVAESNFHLPYIPIIPEITQTITKGNGSISISIQKIASENVNLEGTSWVLNVSKVAISANGVRNGKNIMVNLQGDIKVLEKSGLFYGFNGIISLGDKKTEVSITLVDTNLDLNVKPLSNLTQLSQIGRFVSLGMDTAPFSGQISDGSASVLSISESLFADTQSNTMSLSTTNTPSSTYLLIATLIGVVALVSVISIKGIRRGRKTGSSEDTPLHWVN
ncbi:MAG TPA: hypothetical protein VIH27_00385 [Nitrososphaerales archaeon]